MYARSTNYYIANAGDGCVFTLCIFVTGSVSISSISQKVVYEILCTFLDV